MKRIFTTEDTESTDIKERIVILSAVRSRSERTESKDRYIRMMTMREQRDFDASGTVNNDRVYEGEAVCIRARLQSCRKR